MKQKGEGMQTKDANDTEETTVEKEGRKECQSEKTHLRKCSFGRTNLFLVPSTVRFREVKCTSTLSRQAITSVFHPHASSSSRMGEKGVSSACWHCCHTFEGEDGFRAPRVFDPVEKVFHVYGWFCSANCAKAYVLEHSTFDRGYQMSVFSRMLRDVYSVIGPVVESPPRIALRMFGGPLDIDEFRTHKRSFSIVSPPFVSYCMLVEEKGVVSTPSSSSAPDPSGSRLLLSDSADASVVSSTIGSLRGLRRPDPVPLHEDDLCSPVVGVYSSFLEAKKGKGGSEQGCCEGGKEVDEDEAASFSCKERREDSDPDKKKRKVSSFSRPPSKSVLQKGEGGGGLARFKSK